MRQAAFSSSNHGARRRVACVVSGVLAALGLAVMTDGPADASGPASKRSVARYEIDFLQMMIPHHMMAAHQGTMGPLCVERAVHEELRQLCRSIVTSQQAEIHVMQGWLQSWYGISSGAHDMENMKMTGRDRRAMEQLESAQGAHFEILFLQEMIRHHEGAVREARQCVKKAEHPELVQLCQSIITTQQAEIDQMQAWLCQWYDICRRGARNETAA